MKRLCAAPLLLLAAALAGCSSPAEPLTLPDPATVEMLDIYVWEDNEIVNQRYTRDRRRIAEIITFLNAHNTGYRYRRFAWPWSTVYTINVWGKEDFYLHVGRTWFGGSELERWPAGSRERPDERRGARAPVRVARGRGIARRAGQGAHTMRSPPLMSREAPVM